MITLRKATEADRPMVEQWLADDEFHQSVGVKIEDVYEDGSHLMIAEDDEGPIMAIRVNTAMHVGVQFNPKTKFRNNQAGEGVMEALSQIAKRIGATEIFVKPGGRAVGFVERLGFKDFVGKVFRCA